MELSWISGYVLELLHPDVVKTLLVEGVLHLILNIEQGYQNESGNRTESVNHPLRGFTIQAVQEGRSINQREEIDEYLAVSAEADGRSMRIDGNGIFDGGVHIFQKPKNLESFGSRNFLFVILDKLED